MEETNLLNLVVRYANGESLRSIAKSVGVERHQLTARFQTLGLRIRDRVDSTRKARGPSYEALDWDAIIRRYQAGETVKMIGLSLGFMDTQTLRKRLKELIPLRSSSENAVLNNTKIIPNLDAIAAEHLAGVPLNTLARRVGVKMDTLRRHLESAGHEVRTGVDREWRRQIPLDELVDRYMAGESILALAQHFGATRGSVALRLRAAGVILRGYDANGGKRDQASRAIARQAKLLTVTPAERELAAVFTKVGVTFQQQTPCGSYNLDFTLNGRPVAVEVESGPAFRYPQSVNLWDRTKYILSQGVSILYLVTDYKTVQFGMVVEQAIAFLEVVSANPATSSRYGVIRRNGEPSTLERHNLHGLPRVPGF